MNRFDHCTHPDQEFCDCDWCRLLRAEDARGCDGLPCPNENGACGACDNCIEEE